MSDLSTPNVDRRRLLPRPDEDAFGKLAENIARFLGTSRFIVIQTIIVVVWIFLNVTFAALRFDAYPFILLNLAFSTQAAYAAPLILLAQNRQDDRDRANLLEDRERALRSLADTEFLARELADIRLSLGDVVTRDYLRNELRELLRDLDAQAAGETRGERERRREGGKGGKKKKDRQKPSGAHAGSVLDLAPSGASRTVAGGPPTAPVAPPDRTVADGPPSVTPTGATTPASAQGEQTAVRGAGDDGGRPVHPADGAPASAVSRSGSSGSGTDDR